MWILAWILRGFFGTGKKGLSFVAVVASCAVGEVPQHLSLSLSLSDGDPTSDKQVLPRKGRNSA